MTDIYSALAAYYDRFQAEVDYSAWADHYCRMFEAYLPNGVHDVLDLGCGTGRMALELARRGYSMIGVDRSPEMLDAALRSAEREGYADRMLWLCQDMCDFELYGTVEAVVSTLDCINHLQTPAEVQTCFDLVHNYLSPNGLFLFDINSKHRFEEGYANRSFVFEEEGVMCVWQNDYRPKSRICDFYISVFEEQEDGSYLRLDEVQRERLYSVRQIRTYLQKSGFEILEICGDLNGKALEDTDDRIHFVCRAIK